MSAWGAIAGGFVGTVVLTTAMRAASELGLTRMDLPFLLGTTVAADRTRAKALGFVLHFVVGQFFAFVYLGVFAAIGHSGWALGALFGLLHGLFAGSALVSVLLPVIHPRMGTPVSSAADRPLLEPPGFMMLNYGQRTPLVTLVAHVAYGTIVGGFISLAS
jgi:hypothetical protein